MVRSLLAAYDDTDLFAVAIAEAHERAQLGHSLHEGELAALDAELAKVEAGIDRYLRAFETGAMPEAICGERVKELGRRATALRARRQELADEMDEADLTAPTSKGLAVLRERVAEAVAEGSAASVKGLLQALIHEIRVDSRDAIHPIFRIPVGGGHRQDDAVRAPSRFVDLGSHNKNPVPHISLDACSPEAHIPPAGWVSSSILVSTRVEIKPR